VNEIIKTDEYVARRTKVMRALKDGIGIVFAGDGAPPLSGAWQPDQNFMYLTGISDEPGAAVLFDPKNPDPDARCVLLLKPLNPELEAWDGYREPIGGELRARHGFSRVVRTYHLPRMLQRAVLRRRRLVCLHPFAAHTAPVTPDLELFRKVAQRMVGVSIEEEAGLLAQMRSVKSAAEQRVMKAAIAATSAGFENALRSIAPGGGEREVQRVVEDGFVRGGGSGPAYNSIVGSGVNGTVLHYHANNAVLAEGDLIVIDAGARCGGYAADITRTFPVSGRFTKAQRELYELVLRAQKASIAACRAGATMTDVNAATIKIFEKAGVRDHYPHGIGHHLGLEVHDIDPDEPLRAGAVVTIEPGLYFKDTGTGIRIEDDILITKDGRKNLSSMIPKTVEEIEGAMAAGRKAPDRKPR